MYICVNTYAYVRVGFFIFTCMCMSNLFCVCTCLYMFSIHENRKINKQMRIQYLKCPAETISVCPSTWRSISILKTRMVFINSRRNFRHLNLCYIDEDQNWSQRILFWLIKKLSFILNHLTLYYIFLHNSIYDE